MFKDVYTFHDLQNWVISDQQPPIRLAVFGDPIAHSKSPQMHNFALEKCGIPARYARFHIQPEKLAEALRLLVRNDFIGVNLTIPHKQTVLSLLDQVDENALKIGAVNTVAIREGKLIGFNTDGPGLVRAIRFEFGVDIRDLRVMVLGAGGGAGRAISVQCALEGCKRLVMVNRTLEKVEALQRELEPYFTGADGDGSEERLVALSFESSDLGFQLQNVDLVINATSMGMKQSDSSPLSSSIMSPGLLVFDTIYTAARTPLLRAADETGARGVNGFSMLLYQGALAFEIWFNRAAPLEGMRSALLFPDL